MYSTQAKLSFFVDKIMSHHMFSTKVRFSNLNSGGICQINMQQYALYTNTYYWLTFFILSLFAKHILIQNKLPWLYVILYQYFYVLKGKLMNILVK